MGVDPIVCPQARMNRRLRSVFGVLVISTISCLAAWGADASAVIAKARSYLGTEEALNRVSSIHYVGTLETTEPQENGGPDKPVSFGIEIIFQKPFQQRIVLTGPNLVETTALDGYEGWHRIQDSKDPTRWRTTLYPKNKIKQLRASSWENLGFFSGIEGVGGRVEHQGTVQIEGKTAEKLAFIHEPGIVYLRYFDPETGRLLYTETDQGVRIREEGEIVAGGIRFPKRIVNMTTQAENKERVVTINVDKVTVNEKFADDLFGVPLIPPR